jgi:peroxiredoxin
MQPARFFAVLLALSIGSRAEEPAPAESAETSKSVAPGHSMHGEAFNEGPRQAAVLIPGTGNVHFPVTTSNELAQKFFDQGVGQLHGFWYWEAERSFRQVAALDANCAMAFWGMAMANVNTPKRAAEFIRKATALKEKASRREQLWMASLAGYYESRQDEKERREAMVKALEDLSFEFRDDIEAKAFLVLQIWDNKNHGIAIPSRLAVDAIAQQVLAANPMHPGAHHYLIHLWNYGRADQRALPSAARCGQSAPGIAHMWHMPGHTFSELKRYADAAWQQEASARVDHAYTMRAHVLPDQIHNFAHNNDWLVKDLNNIGRVHDAIDLARNMIELPRLGPGKQQSYRLGRDRLLETLWRYEMWDDLVHLDGTMYLDPFPDPLDEIRRRRALGSAWFQKGETARGQRELDALKDSLAKMRLERIAAADSAEAKAKAEKKPDDQIARAMADALRSFSYRMAQTSSAIAELRVTRALAAGNVDDARKQLAAATDIPAERLARIQFAVGNTEKALQLAVDAASADPKQIQPQANLADLQWRAGKKEDALSTFHKVRELAAQADLDVPVFARLAPIAAELKLPADWRPTPVTADDAGVRPDLAKLGPFRWQPGAAPEWSLPDQTGKSVALSEYAGRPVLILFYLGSVCAHCIEQLNIFAPMTKEFADAGIQIIAISTDSPEGLGKTFAQAKQDGAFTFPIVSDAGLQTFKAYQAFDDFENIPLHGAFLVDGAGRLRWQNISYQPFRDASWLLGEAKRLLSIPMPVRPTAAR